MNARTMPASGPVEARGVRSDLPITILIAALGGEGECQLERQRRIKPIQAARIRDGKKTTRVKYGVDEDTCSGDHSCIRLSGCPTLTLKDSNDPLKVDPVVTITEGCVGCGLCGSNAHAATLCPSFYRIEVTRNPTRWDRVRSWVTTASVARRPS